MSVCFQIGDRVKTTNITFAERGEVVEPENEEGMVFIRLPSGTGWWVKATDLEFDGKGERGMSETKDLQFEAAKANMVAELGKRDGVAVGDFVKIVDPHDKMHGHFGKVERLRLAGGIDYSDQYGVQFPGLMLRWYHRRDIRPLTPEDAAQHPVAPDEPKKLAKAIATTRIRGKTLFKEGYRIRLASGGLFMVYPPGDRRPYKVYVAADQDGLLVQCDCPLFGMTEECKHAIAILSLVENAMQIVENLEESEHGL